MDNFQQFATAINKRLTNMSKGELYVAGDALDKDSIWLTYLDSFPEGTNPMFRERTEHDCSTCRQFVKGFGNVVEIKDGKVYSIWDVDAGSETYRAVAQAMDEFVRSLPLTTIFRSSERTYGAEKTRFMTKSPEGQFDSSATVETWHHFHGRVANRHFTQTVGTDRGNFEATVQVLGRGLAELTPAAVETVVDLIDANTLYRGEEHTRAVNEFRSLQNSYRNLSEKDRPAFIFANYKSPAARFRNTVIGTLVDDLSSGVELERAVRSFEAKVAPTNYKRPKALITPAMVNAAMAKINELGIEDSLKRRFAKLSDVSVNNVLWVASDTQPLMKDSIGDILMGAAAANAPALSKSAKPEEVSIVQFMKDILPGAEKIELLVRNSHEPNFVSLTTGAYEGTEPIFKWGNDFGWSYGGNVTDSIKEKVKAAGGSVTGKLRVSLSWFNYDDLDIHIFEPDSTEIWYSNKTPGAYYGYRKTNFTNNHGALDVDMNAGGNGSREPVENVTWEHQIQNGDYKVVVNQFHKRESSDIGFVIETESNGVTEQYHYDKPMRDRENVQVGTMTVKDGKIVSFKPGKDVHGGSASKEVWGVQTETFVPVTTVMYSPNHWDGSEVGNRHWLFMLKGCLNDTPARGIYNEFLRGDLETHRKVFEVLGDRTKCEPSTDQLSGVGFSSTAGSSVTAKITGSNRQRIVSIKF